MYKLNLFSYKRLTLILISISIVFSMVAGYITASILKKSAIVDMAKVDAKKSSRLIFESLYSAMEKGINKDDLARIINRINNVEPAMKVAAYRSEKVAALFGDIGMDKEVRRNDEAVIRAMNGEDVLLVSDDSRIRYVYAVRVKPECVKCHTNAKEGDINGVIDISYPTTNIKVSLSSMLNYFLLFFGVFFAFTYAIFYYGLTRYLVSPLSHFIDDIKTAIKKRNIKTKLSITSNIYELKNLEKSFNKMLAYMERSRRKELEQVYKDPITGLPNRLKLHEDLLTMQTPLLVILNIDSFKEVNDFYGVKVGDFILSELGSSIKSHCRYGEKLYRFAGDEYAVLVEMGSIGVNIDEYIESFLSNLKNELFMYNDYEISVHMTAGAAIGGKSIMENADMALKQAKKTRKNFIVFDPSMQVSKQYEHNIKWTRILKDALEDDRLLPHFQPILDISTGKITKFECLVRLIEEYGSVVPPFAFLSVAKKSKLYPQLTRAMIEQSFRAFELTNYEFAINLSVDDIENTVTRDFIYEKLANYTKPKRVVFEITESEGIENFTEVLDFIKHVKSLGAKIAIDDFGSGYSNFAYILKLEVDYIKIDASIIKNIVVDKNSYIITKTIVDFCKQIGMQTIAEYVYEKDVYDVVKELGVDFAQGYFIGEPQRDIREFTE